MLPSQNRLVKKTTFKKIAQNARPLHSRYLILKKLPSASQTASQFGIVISAKISKKSTVRNKIKRRLREILRQNLSKLRLGYQVMLVVKAAIIGQNYQAIKQDLEQLLNKVQLFK